MTPVVAAGLDHYGFLASAIAGRRIAVQWADRSGPLAYSDGRSIFLPLSDQASGEAWAVIAAQAALIGADSLHASILRQLVGRPIVARRYLYVEMLRAARVLEHRLPWAFSARSEMQAPPLSESAHDSMELAIGSRPLPQPPDYFGRILPLMAMRAAVSEQGLAALSRKQQRHGNVGNVAELDADDPGESSRLLRLFQNPLATGNSLSQLLNNMLGAGVSKQRREAGAADSGGAELPVGRIEQAWKRGINAVLSNFPLPSPDFDPSVVGPAFTYPEWDVHAQAYRRDWVLVEETEAWREDGPRQDGPRPSERWPGTATAELRRQLNGLGVDQQMHPRQNDGSDLDVDALIECAIELRAGRSPPALRVYRTSRRTRRDLAIAIVVDISGSTGEQPGDGDSVFNKQLQIAYQLGEVLDGLGDTVAIFGFHSWSRKLVRAVRIKDYAERWSLRVAERMALLEPVGYTRIGAAIRHGTNLLQEAMRLPNRLLVLVTDGIAYDQDYELTYAAADASRALGEAREVGTACVCLSVGSGTDTAKLTEVYGAANILAVDEVAQVAGKIRKVCRHALASVSKRRYERRRA